MSSVMPFTFSNMALYRVTIYGKPRIRSREMWRALEYGKATKTADFVKHLCSQENYGHKCQLTDFVSATNLMNWPKDSRSQKQRAVGSTVVA